MLQKTVGGCCSLLTWITKILNLRIFGTKFATADVFFTWAATASQKNKAVDSRSLNQKSVPATISEINRCHLKTSLFCQEINIQIRNIYLECWVDHKPQAFFHVTLSVLVEPTNEDSASLQLHHYEEWPWQTEKKFLIWCILPFNPLHPNINMHILFSLHFHRCWQGEFV